ncbi:unnamed protein product, partial [Anisakis simplex]|uniref:Uncharacterized protein n=1 Tax=Anisakis simplex TaxID=6269 RepID=A0A0M3J9F6_ANISI
MVSQITSIAVFFLIAGILINHAESNDAAGGWGGSSDAGWSSSPKGSFGGSSGSGWGASLANRKAGSPNNNANQKM